jgi:hypothetical protein
MNRIDENLKSNIQSASFDRQDEWLKTHTLSKEQVAQLIRNKYERAERDHKNLQKLKNLIKFD